MTSAEAVLISLQSHAEVLNSLDNAQDRIFVASVSPQVRASIAATYGVSERKAGWMIEQLLAGPQGLSCGGKQGRGFNWVVDTNGSREAVLVLGAEETMESFKETRSSTDDKDGTSASASPKRPILSSACPGWICYAEKTHPHVLPHLSRLKSPQALTGTLLKTVLSKRLNITPDQIWHLAIMPCFDKKLEASREELTDVYWQSHPTTKQTPPIRDVDCVITARELLMLADTRGISFPNLPRQPVVYPEAFPDSNISCLLFPPKSQITKSNSQGHHKQPKEAGTSGGYLHHILQSQLSQHPGSILTTSRGRNADVIEYTIHQPPTDQTKPPVFKAARYYGFRNIQNLVRKLKPPKKTRMPGSSKGIVRAPAAAKSPAATASSNSAADYAYVEVMACPGGCTNGGGQIKIDDLPSQTATAVADSLTQKEWLQRVDEAYFSMSDDDEDEENENKNNSYDKSTDEPPTTNEKNNDTNDEINDLSPSRIKTVLKYWSDSVGIPLDTLVKTSYRKVDSDVGKTGAGAGGGGAGESDRVVEIAGKIGGGW